MKKNIWLVSSLLLAASVSAPAQSSVWKVSSGAHTIYLGGTFHLLRASDFPLPAEFDVAFAASQTLCFEVDIEQLQTPKVQQLLMGEAMYRDGGSLQATVTPEAWAAVEGYCKKAGLPLAQLNQFKPWMLVLQIAVFELTKLGVSSEGVDSHFSRLGKAQGKTLTALETIDEHIGFLLHSADGHESEYILSSLGDLDDIPEKFEAMVNAWRTGDVAALDEALSRELREKYPQMYESLLVQRNRNWLPQIDAMLTSDPVEFVLVGAGHLCGGDGLIVALEARGCTVEQVVAPIPVST